MKLLVEGIGGCFEIAQGGGGDSQQVVETSASLERLHPLQAAARGGSRGLGIVAPQGEVPAGAGDTGLIPAGVAGGRGEPLRRGENRVGFIALSQPQVKVREEGEERDPLCARLRSRLQKAPKLCDAVAIGVADVVKAPDAPGEPLGAGRIVYPGDAAADV